MTGIAFAMALMAAAPTEQVAATANPAPAEARVCPEQSAFRYYPPKAQHMNVEGSASLMCDVTSEGHLSKCVIQSETPEGYGFAETAITLAECLYKVKLGGPSPMQVPFKFKLPPRGKR
jgi:protein TonB